MHRLAMTGLTACLWLFLVPGMAQADSDGAASGRAENATASEAGQGAARSQRSASFVEEFEDGALDGSRWLLARTQWGGVGVNGGVVPENVHLRPGLLVIEGHGDDYDGPVRGVSRLGGKVRPIEHGRRTGACLVTRDCYASGRYEVRMKIPRELGVCSAIWTFHYDEFPPGHAEYVARKAKGRVLINNQEIDIELPGRPNYALKDIGYDWALCNTWIGEAKGEHTVGFTKLPEAVNDGRFHTWRFDWHTGGGGVESSVSFYLDGRLLRTLRTHVPVDAGHLWVGLWFPKHWAGEPKFAVQRLEVDRISITPFHEPNDRYTYSRPGPDRFLMGPKDWPARLRDAGDPQRSAADHTAP